MSRSKNQNKLVKGYPVFGSQEHIDALTHDDVIGRNRSQVRPEYSEDYKDNLRYTFRVKCEGWNAFGAEVFRGGFTGQLTEAEFAGVMLQLCGEWQVNGRSETIAGEYKLYAMVEFIEVREFSCKTRQVHVTYGRLLEMFTKNAWGAVSLYFLLGSQV